MAGSVVLARRLLLGAKAGGGAELVDACCEHRALAAGVAAEQEVVGVGARIHGDRQPTAHGGRRKAKASVTSDWSLADPRVRYCALFRKPRLVDYARFVGWAAVGAPTRSMP